MLIVYGGVIMDVVKYGFYKETFLTVARNKRGLPRKQVLVRSWRWNVYLQISDSKVELQGCLIRK